MNSGDVLVSNFNNAQNIQGAGTTITRITPLGQGIPITYGGATQTGSNAGELTNAILTGGVRNGPLVANPPIQGPWSMTVDDNGTGRASLYLSMVENGTVVRFDFRYDSDAQNILLDNFTTIASGYTVKTDTTGLILGPTGLFHFTQPDPITGYPHDDLFVASSAEDMLFLVTDAGWTTTNVAGTMKGTPIHVVQNVVDAAGMQTTVNPLHGPLGLALAPDGNLVVANSDPANSNDPAHPSELVEFQPTGTTNADGSVNAPVVSMYSIDPATGGAFGLTFAPLRIASSPFVLVNNGQTTGPAQVQPWQLLFVNDNQVTLSSMPLAVIPQ